MPQVLTWGNRDAGSPSKLTSGNTLLSKMRQTARRGIQGGMPLWSQGGGLCPAREREAGSEATVGRGKREAGSPSKLALALREQIGDNSLRPDRERPIGVWTSVTEDQPVDVKDIAVLEGLLARGRAGDDRAMESIYEMFKVRVFQLAYRHTYNVVIAEDLLQDIFLKIFAHLGDVKKAETFPAWVYRITLNTCYSYLRGKKLRSERTVPLSEIEGKLDEAVYDTHEKEIGKPIDDAIRTLPARLRTVFVLHDVEGFKHGEIARILGCSVGTSKSQLFKARLKVRSLLKGKGVL